MEAVESPRPAHGGYRFAVLGDLEADAWDLLQSLYEKIREEMPIRHVRILMTFEGSHSTHVIEDTIELADDPERTEGR